MRHPSRNNIDIENDGRDIYTISRLNLEVRGLLEKYFPLLWVEGEISNISRPRSGHFYFTLKDEFAQIRAAMFRNLNQFLPFQPETGQHVLVRARVSLYEGRGDFQLVVEYMEDAGEGRLIRQYEELKQKLEQEGLFDPKRKRPLPDFPNRIGVITSPTGAALQDVLNVLNRRFPGLSIVVYPVSVQGHKAAPSIVAAISKANHDQHCDALLLVRGGGSREDLWAFNEERVARAIAGSKIPIISGIGHETDFTITDFVADARAPTPSAAAEIACPDARHLYKNFLRLADLLKQRMNWRLMKNRQQLQILETRLQNRHPLRQLQQSTQHLDNLDLRLGAAIQLRLQRKGDALGNLQIQIFAYNPHQRLAFFCQQVQSLETILHQIMGGRLKQSRERLELLSQTLGVVSPLATLQRGYAIVIGEKSGTPLRDAREVRAGENLSIHLANGQIKGIVKETIPIGPNTPTERCSQK